MAVKQIKRTPAIKITPEVLRANPLLAMLIRQRAAEIRELNKTKKLKAKQLELYDIAQG